MKTGIYKITNPEGNFYIGKSKDIDHRWRTYQALRCKNQPKLYRSFIEYGVDNHKFEILELCDSKNLSSLEKKYIDDLFAHNHLNSTNCKYIKLY